MKNVTFQNPALARDLFGYQNTRRVKICNAVKIEIAPLAFMWGRTLSNAFIILDEAQTASSEQMKMSGINLYPKL